MRTCPWIGCDVDLYFSAIEPVDLAVKLLKQSKTATNVLCMPVPLESGASLVVQVHVLR